MEDFRRVMEYFLTYGIRQKGDLEPMFGWHAIEALKRNGVRFGRFLALVFDGVDFGTICQSSTI